MDTKRLKDLAGIVENVNVIHDVAIDYVDDMLAQLSEEERYSEKGDILRYILSRLQG